MALPSDARVLVTGATGFLGTHFLNRLTAEDAEIHAVSRGDTDPRGGRVAWHAADLLNPTVAAELTAKVRPTHILHNAWMAVPGKFWNDESNLQWLEAGIALLRTFRANGGQHFVGVGTCAEYDWSATNFTEDETPIRPATLYGLSKAAMWSSAQAFSDNAFGAAWMRVFLPYGPGDSDKRLVRSVIGALRQGEELALGSGGQIRDFIWAPDIADLAVAILSNGAKGAFNAGTGKGTSVRAVAEYLASRIGRPELLKFGTRADPVSEPPSLVADTGKVERTLGWTPKIDVFSGLDVVLETV
jgi:nucleoside-diphosphate-sugar epimerase